MDIEGAEAGAASIAAAIGVPARARMLYCLLDGRARTSTELAIAADVMPSTASIHLHKLQRQRLVTADAPGKHRYYALEGPLVARALEALGALASGSQRQLPSRVPHPLRLARSCYDHLAGSLGVQLHDRLKTMRWIAVPKDADGPYRVTPAGAAGFEALGIDVEAACRQHRRFAYGCIDWSERRPHLAGALGAALFAAALERRWFARDRDTRALTVTATGRREVRARLGLEMERADAG